MLDGARLLVLQKVRGTMSGKYQRISHFLESGHTDIDVLVKLCVCCRSDERVGKASVPLVPAVCA